MEKDNEKRTKKKGTMSDEGWKAFKESLEKRHKLGARWHFARLGYDADEQSEIWEDILDKSCCLIWPSGQ
jgi:hypothetical protein